MTEPLNFFLGRFYDPAAARTLPEALSYDPANLTTHAVITGMTGSGKTGLGIAILEEAALQGIPAIIVDPKGDLTNLLLHFPDLAPADFQPWLDPDQAAPPGQEPGGPGPGYCRAVENRPGRLGAGTRPIAGLAAGGRIHHFHPRVVCREAG